MDDSDLIPETGTCSRDFNEREFVAKQIARADGKAWHQIPNVSSLWFKDKMHYRSLASASLLAKHLWDARRAYEESRSLSPPTGKE